MSEAVEQAEAALRAFDEYWGDGGPVDPAYGRPFELIRALLAEVRAGVVAEEPEGFYIIPNGDAPDQDSLWDGTIHPTREAAQASLDAAVREWGQDVENYHVVAMVPVQQGDEKP